ncbi:TPA: hypothetical protein ACG0AB_001669 [Elizabethkingia anophelis]|uniref:hypothetical protein n=1 Tax=Elizabethkingia TaxID=308865 RepID=UPI00162899FD|nr:MULTISPECIES: hypothetical protein [Elizabethkingia]MCT3673908.1 hypothetical protein [Elizabethkingia anophelis]MCT3681392.1 hypothetical protein [Elizabethkingia anophelis]MCT3701989.1 hypothetical protein [Elizabethkingia anophelis]MCT3770896.1 hypothetical protein [Elizabethkingia anophelis]MCT3781184.1 hypothetical protein [Elizabethkingia anophelis]
MKKRIFIVTAIVLFSCTSQIQAQSKNTSGTTTTKSMDGGFAGKYSSEGEKNGVLAFDISQTGTKVEGTARYSTYGAKAKNVTLSVKGYVQGKTAYIRLRDKKGSVVADGTLGIDGEDTVLFKQTTSSGVIPRDAALLR